MTTSGTPASMPAQLVEDRLTGVAPARERLLADASWMTGPSMTGSENGMPISMASAPASATARTTSAQSVAEPAGDVGDEQLAAGVARRPAAPSRARRARPARSGTVRPVGRR